MHVCNCVIGQAAVTEEERERLLADLQEKAISLERRLEANLSQDEHLQEMLKEVRRTKHTHTHTHTHLWRANLCVFVVCRNRCWSRGLRRPEESS